MKAYRALYLPVDGKQAPEDHYTLTVGALSLAGAARKASEVEDKNGRGELIKIELTDEVIL